MGIRVASLGLAAMAACGAFGSDSSSSSSSSSGSTGPEDAGIPAPDAGADAALGPTRCGDVLCVTPAEQCCLPLDQGAPKCVARGTPCPKGTGTLQCSSPAACKTGEVCCVVPERNGGQTAWDLARSFCSPASSCPDEPLQRQLCDQGANEQCPGRACKPYLHDQSGSQDLDVNPSSYYTCQ